MTEILFRNIHYYLEVALAKPWYCIVPALLAFVVGTFTVFSLPRSYYAEALVAMETQQLPLPLVAPTVSNEKLQFLEQRVLARENLLELVKRFDLFPAIRTTMPTTRLADLVRSQIKIRVITTEEKKPPHEEKEVGSSAFRIGFKYEDAKLAADVTAALVAMIIEENKRLRVSRASGTTQFLVREVDAVTDRFKARDKELAEYMEENKDALPSRIPTLLVERQEKETDLIELEQSIAELNEDLGELEAELRLGVQQLDGVTSQRLQLNDLRTEMDEKLLVYSERHPEIRSLRQKIETLEKQTALLPEENEAPLPPTHELRNLSPEIGLIVDRIAVAKPRQQTLVEQRDRLVKRLSWLRTTIARAPEVETRLATLRTARDTLQRSLDDLKEKFDSARLGERLEHDESVMQIRVIETPEVPRYPAQPGRTTLMLVVAALSSAAGFAGIYVADMFNRTIRGAFDLAGALEGQTLVVIPRWNPTQRGSGRFGEIAKPAGG